MQTFYGASTYLGWLMFIPSLVWSCCLKYNTFDAQMTLNLHQKYEGSYEDSTQNIKQAIYLWK